MPDTNTSSHLCNTQTIKPSMISERIHCSSFIFILPAHCRVSLYSYPHRYPSDWFEPRRCLRSTVEAPLYFALSTSLLREFHLKSICSKHWLPLWRARHSSIALWPSSLLPFCAQQSFFGFTAPVQQHPGIEHMEALVTTEPSFSRIPGLLSAPLAGFAWVLVPESLIWTIWH